MPKAKSRVRTPRCATCRTRSVGCELDAERVGDVEAVRPGLHEPRGRHRGRRSSAGRTTASSALGYAAQRLGAARAGPCRQRASSSPRRATPPPRAASSSTKPVGSSMRAASTSASQRRLVGAAAMTAASSVQARCATWCGDVPAGGRRRRAPARLVEQPATRASSWSPSAARSASTASSARSFIGVHRSSSSSTSAHWSRIRLAARGVVGDRVGQAEPADQVEGGLHELADPGPRLVDAEQLDGAAGASRGRPAAPAGRRRPAAPGRCGPRPTARGRRRRPGAVKWSPSISSTARVRRGPRRQLRPPRRAARRRARSVRCSTAATTRSFLVGKWCSWAPAADPGPLARPAWSTYRSSRARPGTRRSRPAAAARIARVRSSCGTRGDRRAVVMTLGWPRTTNGLRTSVLWVLEELGGARRGRSQVIVWCVRQSSMKSAPAAPVTSNSSPRFHRPR